MGTELFSGGVETLVFVYLKAYLCKPKPCVRTVEKLTIGCESRGESMFINRKSSSKRRFLVLVKQS